MNFNFTWKNVAWFILALIVATATGMLFDNQYLPLAILAGACYWIATKDKK